MVSLPAWSLRVRLVMDQLALRVEFRLVQVMFPVAGWALSPQVLREKVLLVQQVNSARWYYLTPVVYLMS